MKHLITIKKRERNNNITNKKIGWEIEADGESLNHVLTGKKWIMTRRLTRTKW